MRQRKNPRSGTTFGRSGEGTPVATAHAAYRLPSAHTQEAFGYLEDIAAAKCGRPFRSGGWRGGLAVLSELRPDQFAEKKEKEFLDPSCSGDSGDLDVREDSGSEELAPIVLTPPFLLPGYEPTSEPPASIPSPSGSFGSLDAGAPVRWYSGRTADGAGGLEPGRSCNALPGRREILPSLAGLLAETTCYLPVNLLAHVSVNKSLAELPRLFLHQAYTGYKSCKHPADTSFRRIHRYETYTSCGACIRVNSPLIQPLRVLVYSDVRGPPSVNSALLAALAL